MKKFTLFLVAMTMSLFSLAQTQMSGTYTVGTGGTYDYASMADAGMAIKSAEFTGDVTLLICTDLTETINTGIVNKSEYTLTIRPDKDENRTITYTTAKDNTGPTGVFVIGGDMTKTPGTTIGWASVPTKNVIVDGAAEGKTTPRLQITNEVFGTNVLLYGDVQNVVIKNCILTGKSSGTAYALVFRSENYSETSKDIAPKNCLVENCILQSSSSSSQTVYFQGNQANSVAGWPANITIRNSSIKARTRGLYVRQVNNLTIEGCTFDMSNSTSGILAHAIMGEAARGTINVKGNKFIKNSTANTYGGAYGLQTITASGGADVWVIENNYFAGYDALKAISNTTKGTEARLVAVRCGDYCEVRHNTFYMPNLTKDQASQLVSASPTTLLWLAGSHQYPVQNNIFVCEETTANVSLIRGRLNENVTGNVFYHKGGNAAIVAAAPSCMTFADLETSYPAQAATSKWTNVTFADAANGDLSLDGSSDGDANLAVDRLPEVLTDINGTARREKTYAGAYEGSEFPAEVCNVTATVAPVGSGIVEGVGDYAIGSSITLTPKPNTGYEFTGWTFEDETTSTESPLNITVNSDINITANFAKKKYTLIVQANDPVKGSVAISPEKETYEHGTEVEITATVNEGYEFIGWCNGSKTNPLKITMEGNTELTANFRAVLATSITLNAHPVKDYSASIVGTMKRAIQNGENTIVLTHEAKGTAHIYNIAHATKEVTEISQEGVNAAADGFLAISDIAVTEDGKLVACNYVHCTFTPSNTSYFYIWDDLTGNPAVWFTSQKSGNYNDAYMGYTMALKGTSQKAEVTISAFNKSNTNTRYSHLYVVDGTYTDASYKYSRDNAALHPNALGKNTYELNASPLAAGKWIVDGELASPIEFVEKDAFAIDTYTALNTNILGEKYNGASYLFHNDHHLMVAPYAVDDKLAGVKVLGITDGFNAAVAVETKSDLSNAIDATSAAATAYVDNDGKLTIYLIADGKVYAFSEKAYEATTYTITATASEGGTVEGGGQFEESSTVTLKATPDEIHNFVNWTKGEEIVSTKAIYTFEVTESATYVANFVEKTKYTINVILNEANMGSVTGAGEYYEGVQVTLKATAKGGYVFENWSDGNTEEIRTFTAGVDLPETLTANFKAAVPRAWAYDLRKGEDEANYTFTFKTTSACAATLIFTDKDGNPMDFGAHASTAKAAEEKTITIAKSIFADATKDIYWSVKMEGEAITKMAELTDPTKGIYDFYNMMGVVVDNDPNSDEFGKIYIQQSYEYPGSGNTAERNKTQKSGIFIYDQDLKELNNPANVGIQPQLPYTLGGNRQNFKRLSINPTNNQMAFCNNVAGSGAVWSINRDDLTAEAVNIVSHITDINNVNAICFDKEGCLYLVANVVTNYTNGDIYKIEVNGTYTKLTPLRPDGKKIWVDEEIAIASDGRGGIWVAQKRDGITDYSALFHVNFEKNKVDFVLEKNKDYSDWFEGTNRRGAIAYDEQRNILAVHGPSVASLFSVEYDTEGVPTITKHLQTPNIGSLNIDGLAFDYAGDLYLLSSGTERFYKYVLPIADNTCIVHAPALQKIEKEQKYAVTVVANPSDGGIVSVDATEFVAGDKAKVTATASLGYEFVNWTINGEEVSPDANFEYSVPAENVTLTANFKLVTYSLITSTNDENKGTVSVEGECTHESTVTLTAHPADGYKLLYWSDRSTENPRTITMTKNEAISAYFVKEYDVEPTFTIEKVWENTNVPTSTNNGYQAIGWDEKIYMQNRTAGKIQVFSNDTDNATDYAVSGAGQQIAVDEAGNLIVFNNTNFYDPPTSVLIYAKGTTNGTAISFELKDPARCDFFSASGDIFSTEGGYVYFYCNGKTAVNRLKITNGAVSEADVTTDLVGGSIYATNQNQNHVMVDIFGNLVTHARSNSVDWINVYTNECKTFTLPSIKMSTLGGCSFELGGKELWAYNVGTTHYNSEWNIYNLTDEKLLSETALYAKNTTDKNAAANWLNVQVVDEKTAYIYQFCPTVAVAVWKVSCTTDINVTIDEKGDNTTALTPYEGKEVTANVTRNFGANKILTLTLPFDMDAVQISQHFGNATVYEFYNVVDADEELHLQFSRTTSIEAGKPYLIQTTSGYDAEDGFTIENVVISTELNPVKLSGITMVPVLDAGGTLDQPTQYYLSNNALYCAGEHKQSLLGLRAFFTSDSPTQIRARVIFDENEETSIPVVTAPENNTQKVIKDGRLIIIRGEQQYNAQGQIIE